MAKEWHELTPFIKGAAVVIERIRLENKGISVDGDFELPPLARLSVDDQYFVMAFVQHHGSIKEMEKLFGISYPTVKNRLNRLAQQLNLVETCQQTLSEEVIAELAKGKITAAEAIERLEG